MIKLIKNTICFFILLVFLTNCGSVKNAFSKSKNPDGAEFLVKKKNPLIMPSEFNVLPRPGNLNNNKNQDVNTFDIKKALGNKSKIKISSSKKTNSSLEKSILEKINKE
jgi:hypothetical protein